MKKVARFIKKTKIKDYLKLASGENISVTKGIIEDAQKVGSSARVPYLRVIKTFLYQNTPLFRKVPVLANFNELLLEWDAYNSSLKVSDQIEKMDGIKEYLETFIKEISAYIKNIQLKFSAVVKEKNA